MEQETTSQRILAELLELGIVQEKDEEVAWAYLAQAYAVGYDEGRKEYSHRKPIGQYSVEGKLVKIWESSSSAAKHFGLDKSSISKCALGKHATSAGFRWKYIDVRSPTFFETETPTIGSVKPQSIRPTQKSHFSKKV